MKLHKIIFFIMCISSLFIYNTCHASYYIDQNQWVNFCSGYTDDKTKVIVRHYILYNEIKNDADKKMVYAPIMVHKIDEDRVYISNLSHNYIDGTFTLSGLKTFKYSSAEFLGNNPNYSEKHAIRPNSEQFYAAKMMYKKMDEDGNWQMLKDARDYLVDHAPQLAAAAAALYQAFK